MRRGAEVAEPQTSEIGKKPPHADPSYLEENSVAYISAPDRQQIPRQSDRQIKLQFEQPLTIFRSLTSSRVLL
jgi:hypothetical protein